MLDLENLFDHHSILIIPTIENIDGSIREHKKESILRGNGKSPKGIFPSQIGLFRKEMILLKEGRRWLEIACPAFKSDIWDIQTLIEG